MEDYAERFGQLQDGSYEFSAARQGTITGLMCIGAMLGSLVAGKMADVLGRRLCISASALFCCIGTIVEITSSRAWAQFAVGRLLGGVGIGALSVSVPMYQSESAPAILRGVLVAMYQMMVTLGIWLAYMIDYGTESINNSASWRIPIGIDILWALILGLGILVLPESPRYAYSKGRIDEARATIARLAGLDVDHAAVRAEMEEIRAKVEEEKAAANLSTSWTDIFTGPAMLRRTLIGCILQAGQQLTGANFFFYYGTTIFAATGLSNSYITQIILGSVNVLCTIVGLYIVKHSGRRAALMVGAAWMMMCFFIYAFVGHFCLDQDDPASTPNIGKVLIVFSCLFIAAFATTWGPLVWAVVAELYPTQYRAPCMALATASNWLFNFLLSFFTRFITGAIDYLYGLVFAGCCAALVVFVFFFVVESKDRTLEEIDTMYVLGVNPITSHKWQATKNADTVEKRGSNEASNEGVVNHV